ncbi:unnamed protein product [Oppiella nova]|uniref:ABC transporter domain-containing protein n=1 Tax=Oppiella nova TaxID=334625 RepID=A0A7R9LLM4_9ACAR|nr:unnamed protein product [Oppiella nova]CAG2164857.1 unnamed protein product [Oppiella nova]
MEISSINSSDGVLVQNLYFGYSRRSPKPEINNANLCVPRGVIYGLLGPSGCGKTTLLRCIIGRLKPRKGLVRVFDTQPGAKGTRESGVPGPGIGYMPQELALISQFTIKETLRYYAGFCNTDRTIFTKRMHFLLQLLELSHLENKFVDNLSGGQKRRVSLAIALINNPPLLILDEPTVGVDPILRECIWNYLVQISKEGLTSSGADILMNSREISRYSVDCYLNVYKNSQLIDEICFYALDTTDKCNE